MTQNQKILIGVGLLGLGYLLWKNSKKSTQVADSGNGTTDSGNGLSESLPSVIKPAEKGLNEKCSGYAGNQLAAMFFLSAEAHDKEWKREYDKCMAGKMENVSLSKPLKNWS